jgi:riboflavin synthase
MFSGIIEQTAKVLKVEPNQKFTSFRFGFTRKYSGLEKGESIAINGVCLTVVKFTKDYFEAQAIGQTLKDTNLGDLKNGMVVNLERALKFQNKVSGHFVSGHVDGMGQVSKIYQKQKDYYYEIKCPKQLLVYFVPKGSVTIDGISLTIQNVKNDKITVSIIPHTLKMTNLVARKEKDAVNLEVDQLARYALKQKQFTKKSLTKLTVDKLIKLGF